ncbi:hypothetical protein SMSP2_02992 [Limihaloglobus sulfuriphilus]|uniref:Uncharacterized protein n=1 Tax=Limihaloglobus sulfuriphilus TaxID=1851148 RepID=A0A1Q2MJE6_9BACT|nr:hypothetical protein SMSP2_02992 [Limihaloglobus sulfuriphilus]
MSSNYSTDVMKNRDVCNRLYWDNLSTYYIWRGYSNLHMKKNFYGQVLHTVKATCGKPVETSCGKPAQKADYRDNKAT